MSSGVGKKRDIKGLIVNVSVTNFICNTYSIRIAIWISRTAIYCDTVLVGDTHPYYPHDGRADNTAYPHDSRADKQCYRPDRRADSQCYRYWLG